MKLLFILFTGLFVTFCSPREDVLDGVRKAGVLRVVTRNNPTSYYIGANGPTGLEYDLARGFADSLGVQLEISTTQTPLQAMEKLRRGEAHLAAAGLAITPERKRRVRFGPIYQQVGTQLIYRRGDWRPRSPADLRRKGLEVGADSLHIGMLKGLEVRHPGIQWMRNAAAYSDEMLNLVRLQIARYTVAHTNEFALVRQIYPELGVAFDFKQEQSLAWAFPLNSDDSLYIAAIHYFNRLRSNGKLAQLVERHYGHVSRFDYVATRKLLQHLDERLPRLLSHFYEAGKQRDLDWKLLAAMGYQESHWDPLAKSPTGVRGIMMLTRDTAAQVEVQDRLDPRQSIFGGARYFSGIRNKIPERIPEPDRTWFALAAYNVGFGHLEDARILAEKDGANADRWIDLKRYLPLLSQKKWYRKTRYGYARGYEPVRYVENIRRYYDLLTWHEQQLDSPLAAPRQHPDATPG